MVKVIDILLGDGVDDAVILPVAVNSLEWPVHCSVAQDKGQARIIKRGLVVVPGLWGRVCYPEANESQNEDGDERVGDGAGDEVDASNRGEAGGGRGELDGDRGGKERVANYMVAAAHFCAQGGGIGKKVNLLDRPDGLLPPWFPAVTEACLLDEHPKYLS